MGKRQSPIKVSLTNRGKDTETPWAEDLGPAPFAGKTARLVRLVNVPFLHAKPTWGDTIVVKPDSGGILTWDRGGQSFSKVDSLIHEDGDRWAMIVDYAPHPDSDDADRVFSLLARACAEHDVVCEGAWGPRDDEPGRAYLAVKSELSDADLMKHLRAGELPCELIQIHPAPSKKKAPAKKPAKKTAAKKPAAKKPAVKKPAKKPVTPARKKR
jgi:hypothetical protein